MRSPWENQKRRSRWSTGLLHSANRRLEIRSRARPRYATAQRQDKTTLPKSNTSVIDCEDHGSLRDHDLCLVGWRLRVGLDLAIVRHSTNVSGGDWAVCSFHRWPLLFALRHAQKAIGPLVLLILGGMVRRLRCLFPGGPDDLELREKFREEPKLWSLAGNALQSDAAHEWMEARAFYMQSGGLALACLAWIWLLVRAFRQHRRWGLGSLVLPPVGLVFAGRYPRKGVAPLILFLLVLLVAATPAFYTLFVPLDLGPLETSGRRPAPSHADRLGPQGLLDPEAQAGCRRAPDGQSGCD